MSRPGAPRRWDEADRGLHRTGGSQNAKFLRSPNIFLGPVRACALLARNEDPWQHRSPLHELRFVLGALLGTNWRRELLGEVLLAWLLLCPRVEGERHPANMHPT